MGSSKWVSLGQRGTYVSGRVKWGPDLMKYFDVAECQARMTTKRDLRKFNDFQDMVRDWHLVTLQSPCFTWPELELTL